MIVQTKKLLINKKFIYAMYTEKSDQVHNGSC